MGAFLTLAESIFLKVDVVAVLLGDDTFNVVARAEINGLSEVVFGLLSAVRAVPGADDPIRFAVAVVDVVVVFGLAVANVTGFVVVLLIKQKKKEEILILTSQFIWNILITLLIVEL